MTQEIVARAALIAFGGVAGGTIGLFIGQFIARTIEEKEWAEEAEFLEESSKIEEPPAAEWAPEKEEATVPEEKVEPKKKKMERVDYTSFRQNAVATQVPLEELERLAKRYESKEPERVEVISFEQYQNPDDGYEKLSWSFSTIDGSIADENDEVVDNPAHFIGNEATSMFGKMSDDPDIVYVRNNDTHTDYELIRQPNTFKADEIEEEMTIAPKKKTSKRRKLSDN